MKSFIHPRKIAGITTLALMSMALLFFAINYLSNNLLLSLIISIPLMGAVSFFLIQYFISNFIYEKIKPIYKTINSFRAGHVLRSDPFQQGTDHRAEGFVLQ